MYRYKDGRWDCFFIDDSLQEWRKYNQFCVDIYNNLWIATHIFNNKRNGEIGYHGYSELLKYDGKSLKKIIHSDHSSSFSYLDMKATMPNTIASLKDGSIAILRSWFETPTEYDENNHNLYIIKPNEAIEKYQIPSISGEKTKLLPKNVNSIIEDKKGNLWLPQDRLSWTYDSSGQMRFSACCGGLVNFKDKEWLVFDNNNNLKTYWNQRDTFFYAENISAFMELDNNNYFMMGDKSIYSMGNDYILKEISLKAIGDNSLIIRSKKTWTTDEYKYIYRFDDTSATAGDYLLTVVMDFLEFEDNIWIITQPGIIVFPKSMAILEVDEQMETYQEMQLYPNPASDVVNIKNLNGESNFVIYNHLGEFIEKKTSYFPSVSIDIRKYLPGSYFIRLENNHKYNLLKFIKK